MENGNFVINLQCVAFENSYTDFKMCFDEICSFHTIHLFYRTQFFPQTHAFHACMKLYKLKVQRTLEVTSKNAYIFIVFICDAHSSSVCKLLTFRIPSEKKGWLIFPVFGHMMTMADIFDCMRTVWQISHTSNLCICMYMYMNACARESNVVLFSLSHFSVLIKISANIYIRVKKKSRVKKWHGINICGLSLHNFTSRLFFLPLWVNYICIKAFGFKHQMKKAKIKIKHIYV